MSATPDELGKRLGPRMAWAPKSPAARLAAFACATVLGVIGLVAFFQRGEPGEPFAVAPIRVRPVLPPAAPVDMAAAPAAAIEPRPTANSRPLPIRGSSSRQPMGRCRGVPRTDLVRPRSMRVRPKKARSRGSRSSSPASASADGLTAEAVEKLPSDVTLAFGPYGDRPRESRCERPPARPRGSAPGADGALRLPRQRSGPAYFDRRRDDARQSRPAAVGDGPLHGLCGCRQRHGRKTCRRRRGDAPILAEIGERGLLFLDDGTLNGSAAAAANADTPVARADAVLDAALAPDAFERELKRLEETARARGFALGTASLRSLAVDGIARWAQTLEGRGFRLVPVSAAYEAAGVAQR